MLTKQEVKHIAHLARIELSDKEVEKYQEQLGEILNYVNKLEEVDISGIETSDGGTRGLYNIWMEDEVRDKRQETRDKEKLIEMAPLVQDRQVKVKSVCIRDKEYD